MAAHPTFGKTPKTFKKIAVKFQMPDGEPGAIATVFKYRTVAGYGQYLNELFSVTETEKPEEGEKPDFVKICAKNSEKGIEKLLDAIESWDFGHDLTKETLVQLQNEFPASIAAFGEVYRAACIEGKLGN